MGGWPPLLCTSSTVCTVPEHSPRLSIENTGLHWTFGFLFHSDRTCHCSTTLIGKPVLYVCTQLNSIKINLQMFVNVCVLNEMLYSQLIYVRLLCFFFPAANLWLVANQSFHEKWQPRPNGRIQGRMCQGHCSAVTDLLCSLLYSTGFQCCFFSAHLLFIRLVSSSSVLLVLYLIHLSFSTCTSFFYQLVS